MLYLDTSFVVSLLVPESHTDRAAAWVKQQETGSLAISLWVATEVSSALSIKRRMGMLDADRHSAALAAWRELVGQTINTLPIANAHFTTAATFADRFDLGIRAGDALHLAIAASTGATLVTFDRTMIAAAPLLGIPLASL